MGNKNLIKMLIATGTDRGEAWQGEVRRGDNVVFAVRLQVCNIIVRADMTDK